VECFTREENIPKCYNSFALLVQIKQHRPPYSFKCCLPETTLDKIAIITPNRERNVLWKTHSTEAVNMFKVEPKSFSILNELYGHKVLS
jgi:hypothetical protein